MTKDELRQNLFTERTNVYAILDGASIADLRIRLYESSPPHYCLFRGELPPDVQEAAPYLVGLIDGSPFTEWMLDESFGNHWGIYAHSKHSITEMRRHFRGLINVHDEAGNPMIFRYYDPRVLTSFLPTCDAEQLQTFFGKIDIYFAEDRDGTMLSSFTFENNELRSRNIGKE